MKFVSFLLMLASFGSFACSRDQAFEVGFKAITNKHTEFTTKREIFHIVELKDVWLILRKDKIFKENPGEYPRVAVAYDTCKAKNVVWSK